MHKHLWGALSVLVLCTCLVADEASAQAVYGSIRGTVRDPSGAVMLGVTINIRDLGRGIDYATTTNESGNYRQMLLRAGRYQVTVKAPGFRAYVRDVDLSADTTIQVDVALQLGGISEQVTVSSGDVPLLKTERTDVATTFTEKDLIELPILNRNVTKFELLTPGVQLMGWQHAASENPQGGYQVSSNGQYYRFTSHVLDGTDNRDPILGITVINPTVESVAEMKFTSQNYSAEWGGASGGVFNITTKSGSNELHGSAFTYYRGDWLMARNPFSQSLPLVGTTDKFIPDTGWYQFGGSMGGPIVRNKLFFFADYQGNRRKQGAAVLTRVPTDAEKNGDLSALGVNIYDPRDAAGNEIAPANREQFKHPTTGKLNVIPSSRLSPQAQSLLEFLPPPNVPGATGAGPNYLASGTQNFNDDAFNVRIDEYVRQNVRAFGRYSFAEYHINAPGAYGDAGGPPLEGTYLAGKSDVRNQNIAAGFDWTLRPNLLTDFRFGFFRYGVAVAPLNVGTSPLEDAGIPGMNRDDFYTSGLGQIYVSPVARNGPYGSGVGGFNLGFGGSINQCNAPLRNIEMQYQFVDNWTYARGNHSFRFGADFRFLSALRVNSYPGYFTFSDSYTAGPTGGGLGLAAFLLGDVSSFSRRFYSATDSKEYQRRMFMYGEDVWRITPKFSMTLGLRWQVFFPVSVDGPNRGGWLDLDTGEFVVSNQDGESGFVTTNYTNFGPRLGIAYTPNPKTVLRLGIGRDHDTPSFFAFVAASNLPVVANQSVSPSASWRSVFKLSQGAPDIDPTTILNTQPKGPNGNPILPNGIGVTVIPDKGRVPTVDTFNATLQRQLTPTMSAEVAYVGIKGTHVSMGQNELYNVNQATMEGYGVLNTNQRKPYYSKYGWTQGISYWGADASSNFHSLQTKLEKRFSKGFSFLTHYTLARMRDYGTNYFVYDARGIAYGPGEFQRTHQFVLTEVWELPFGNGRRFMNQAPRTMDIIFGGWQISSITVWESGLPFTPSYQSCGSDQDTGVCIPNRIGAPEISNPSQYGWFATAGSLLATNGAQSGPWSRPAKGVLGNAGRNSMRGPSRFNTDLSLVKNFNIRETIKVQFRAEVFNIFNVVNLSQPDGCVDCPTAGRIYSTILGSLQRQVQFALRFQF